MYVTGRSLADPLGTLRESVVVAPGQATAGSLNAGFHGGIGVDPRDGTTFWAVNVYQPAPGGWQTWVAAFGLGDKGSAPSVGLEGGLSSSSLSLRTGQQSLAGARRPPLPRLPAHVTDAAFTLTSAETPGHRSVHPAESFADALALEGWGT
jgi:hypothetical protein